MRPVHFIVVPLLIGPCLSVAAELPEQILFCRTVGDAVERANCYDRAVDALRHPTAPEKATTTATHATTPTPPTEAEVPVAPEDPEHQVAVLEKQVEELEQQVAALQENAPPEASVSPEELFGKPESDSRDTLEKLFGIADIDEIESVVTESKRTSYGKLVLVLENGQIWSQIDSTRLFVEVGDGVRIEAGVSGSFLLSKQTGSRSIRVKRID